MYCKSVPIEAATGTAGLRSSGPCRPCQGRAARVEFPPVHGPGSGASFVLDRMVLLPWYPCCAWILLVFKNRRQPSFNEHVRNFAMPLILRHQIVRFLLVGALNSSIGYAIYACLLRVGLPYAAASFGALVLGILVSFRTQGALVFGNRDYRLIFRFAACWGAIFVLNTLFIGWLIGRGLGPYFAGALALIPIATFSYLTQKFLVFKTANPSRTHDG